MTPEQVSAIVSAVIRGLDLIDRFATSFDSEEELNEYIAERDQVRQELVAHARELGGGGPADDSVDSGVNPEQPSSEPTGDQGEAAAPNADGNGTTEGESTGDATTPHSQSE